MDMFKEYGITLEEAKAFINTIGKIVEDNTEGEERWEERWEYFGYLWNIKMFLQEKFEK